jgi:hypothetical protein
MREPIEANTEELGMGSDMMKRLSYARIPQGTERTYPEGVNTSYLISFAVCVYILHSNLLPSSPYPSKTPFRLQNLYIIIAIVYLEHVGKRWIIDTQVYGLGQRFGRFGGEIVGCQLHNDRIM